MGRYIFLEDGRRVDVSDGRVTLFPDADFKFRETIHLGDIERAPDGWLLRRSGRDLGVARSRRAAVARLMEDAAEDIAAREQKLREERAAHAEASSLVRRFLPSYAGDRMLAPYLVFSGDELMQLLDAVEESALHDEQAESETIEEPEKDWRSEIPEPTFADLAALVRKHLGLNVEHDAAEMAQMAALGLTVAAWRNTHLESLHAGSHPSGGFSDTDMMRYNIATSRAIARHVTTAGVDWGALHGLLTDPDRRLPGGITIRELAGDELHELLTDALGELWVLQCTARDEGWRSLYARLALRAAMYARDWYGTPWWPDVVDAFLDMLADPSSDAWARDDRSKPEPASVADRAALRSVLLERPQELDDDGIHWCHSHGLAFLAPSRGFALWRRRRDPDWKDPNA